MKWLPCAVAICAPLAGAAAPVCCRLFGIDATPMLGSDPATCGKVVGADQPFEAQDRTVENRRQATRCALEAQEQGRAFVYTYRLLVSPDIDLIVQGVFGLHGERMLLKLGKYARENIRTVEICESLTVLPDGKLKSAGCYNTDPRS